jgi:hypothetical protein
VVDPEPLSPGLLLSFASNPGLLSLISEGIRNARSSEARHEDRREESRR